MALTRRNRRTLAAAARVMVPPGGAVAAGADELGLAATIAGEVDAFPRVPRNLVRLLLFAVEHYPLISGRRRRFTALATHDQAAFLDGLTRKGALRRLVYSNLKSIVFGAFVSHPDVEKVIGYRYECLRPLDAAAPREQIHH